VTVHLETVDLTSPPAFRPCDWVTPEEAAAHLGVIPIANTAEGDQQGSADVSCIYSFNDTPDRSPNRHSVSSQLRLTAAHVIDAASEFAFNNAKNSTTVDGIGFKAAGTPVSTSAAGMPVHRLQVLLPGERLYYATG
jgi:hypothetical protein